MVPGTDVGRTGRGERVASWGFMKGTRGAGVGGRCTVAAGVGLRPRLWALEHVCLEVSGPIRSASGTSLQARAEPRHPYPQVRGPRCPSLTPPYGAQPGSPGSGTETQGKNTHPPWGPLAQPGLQPPGLLGVSRSLLLTPGTPSPSSNCPRRPWAGQVHGL